MNTTYNEETKGRITEVLHVERIEKLIEEVEWRLNNRINDLERRLESTLEANELWDGS